MGLITNLLGVETCPLLHQLEAFVSGHGIHIPGVWISFLLFREGNFFFPSFGLAPSSFLLKMCCIFCQLEWNLVDFSYHWSREVRGFSQVITCFCSGVRSISQKRSMIATDAASPDCVTNILCKLAMCSLMLPLLAIWRLFISSRASPGPSNGLKDFLIASQTSL